tara:strand:- start:117 stop:242 length:126 start_codon:yes stop_codon:yes gene_type:complete
MTLTRQGHALRKHFIRKDKMGPYAAFKKALAEQPKKQWGKK